MATVKVKIPKSKALAKKRKHIEDKLNEAELIQPENFMQESQAVFNVVSSTDDTKVYTVSISNGFNGIKYECNCGDQWDVEPRRNNCRHIGGVIANMMKIFVFNHNDNLKPRRKCKKLDSSNESMNKVMDATDVDVHEMGMDELVDKFKELF